MEDELDLDVNPDLDPEEDKKRDREKLRIKDLADKTKVAIEARAKAEAERDVATKEASFFKNFNTLTPKYQGAAEFQDKIKEKVMAGYDVEDATISILAKEGKYQPPAPESPKLDSPAGGSAVNTIAPQEKTIENMNKDERRAALTESLNKGEVSFKNL